MPKCLNSNGLKWVAVIAMLIDHGALALIENRILGGPFHLMAAQTSPYIAMWWKVDVALRLIGRLSDRGGICPHKGLETIRLETFFVRPFVGSAV